MSKPAISDAAALTELRRRWPGVDAFGLDLAYQSARAEDRRMVQWAMERCAAL